MSTSTASARPAPSGPPRTTTVVVVGAGPAGLAMSRCLSDLAIDHLVVERGRVAERWRSERWDSLRLLTPNWMTRLPGWTYRGDEPAGYMSMPEVVAFLDDYSRSFDAPVVERTEVRSVRPAPSGFEIVTDRGVVRAEAVVLATGGVAAVPAWGSALAPTIEQLHSSRYRRPEQLPEGGVLVVGASASGIQIADELRRAGRDVTLAVGRHVRIPRSYRGRDIHWWLDLAGTLDVTIDQVIDVERARRAPSLQLVGSDDGHDVDLNRLVAGGVRLTGRALGTTGWSVDLAGDLARQCRRADASLERLLRKLDAVATAAALDDSLQPPTRPRPTTPPSAPRTLDLDERGIGTVLWATGFRWSYPWLSVPVLDRRGAIRHRGGVTDWPGLYVMGLPFMRRRSSTSLDGFGADAAELATHLAAFLRAHHTNHPTDKENPS